MKNSSEADSVLIQRALSNSASAWHELFNRYQNRLSNYLKGRGLSAFDADDIAQSVWLKVIRILHTYRFESSFFTWLCTIGRNTHVDTQRSRYSRHHSRLSTLVAERLICVEQKQPDPTPEAQVDQLLVGVHLSPDLEEVLRRHYRLGQKTIQIADHMGIPEGTVKSRLHRLRRILAAS
jgi:RNA polymerase sigma-70 factor, ECF subfamily